MQQNCSDCPARSEAMHVMLMARLLDQTGKPLLVTDVRTISYQLFAANPASTVHSWQPQSPEMILYPQHVIHESVCIKNRCLRDAIAHNFSHLFSIPSSNSGIKFEVRYRVTKNTGDVVLIRFRIRIKNNDRHRTNPIHPQPDACAAR